MVVTTVIFGAVPGFARALGIREQMPQLQASAARDRQAAYTLFVEAYGEVRAAIAYVRRKEDDIDSIMPHSADNNRRPH